MASRNYGLAYDTPYNEQLVKTLRKYNMERDTNGEPNNMHQASGDPMTGGAFLSSDGAISRKTLRYHPHLSHPLSGSMAREMGDSMLGMGVMSGGLRPPGMVSPFVQSASPSHMVTPGTMATYPVYNAVEQRAMDGGFFFPAAMALGRIAGPAIASAAIGALASKGMDKILGSGSAACSSCEAAQPCSCSGGAKKKRGRPKKGGNILDRKFSINDVKNTGRELLGLGILDEKFSINDIGRTGKQLFGKGRRGRPKGSKGKMKGGISFKDVTGKVGNLLSEATSVAKPIIKDTLISVGKDALMSYLGSKGSKAPVKRGKGVMSGGMVGVGVMKGGAMDGRKRRAEIVKKVMKEQGMKMTDASKYVKQHGLYK